MDGSQKTLERLRLFLAVPFPQEFKEEFAQAARTLKITGAKIVRAENIHLTLRFLGSCPVEMVEDIGAAAARAAAAHTPYAVTFGGFGAFPSRRRPRVIWIGIEEGAAATTGLREDIETAMEGLGFEVDDRFDPHVTVARIKSPRIQEGWLPDEPLSWEGRRCDVDHVVLYRSVLSPKGPEYFELKRIRLGN